MSRPILLRRLAKCEQRCAPQAPLTFTGYTRDADSSLVELFPVPGRRPDPTGERRLFTFTLDRPQFSDRKFDA